jgi:hypothetical protein
VFLAGLATAYAHVGQFDDAWRCIREAQITDESSDAEVVRIAGEIALLEPNPDAAKPETCFYRALDVARQQQAKSLELRAATSMARLWRDRGNRKNGCETRQRPQRSTHLAWVSGRRSRYTAGR